MIGVVAAIGVCLFAATVSVYAQTSDAAPKVKQIDILALRRLVRPNGKPLLINFWAT